MGQVIAVVSGKGGTGKTSLAAHVGLHLAALGNLVLCLDCDMGLRNLDLALGMSDRAVMDFTDVVEGRCTLREAAAAHPVQKNLFLLTAPSLIRTVDRAAFARLTDEIRRRFDYCLVDAPAGLEEGFRLAMKSTGCEAEVEAAGRAIRLLGGELRESVDYTIPSTDVTHRLVVVAKTAPTPKKYPRAFAQIKKQPL